MIERFVKSFSKGQITIPKAFREKLGLGDVFWLRLRLEGGKIVAEPVREGRSTEHYHKRLLKIKGKWFKSKEWQEVRKEFAKRIRK